MHRLLVGFSCCFPCVLPLSDIACFSRLQSMGPYLQVISCQMERPRVCLLPPC